MPKLMPALSLAQSAQVSPLPKAPPEILSKEARDPRACAQQGLTGGQDNKPQSADITGKSLSEQLARSDGVYPAARCRSGHQGAHAGRRQHASDPAAW